MSDVPEYVAAYAAGIYTVEPEVSWTAIATLVDRIGLGRYTADTLAAAAGLWASKNGTNLSALAARVREARRPSGR